MKRMADGSAVAGAGAPGMAAPTVALVAALTAALAASVPAAAAAQDVVELPRRDTEVAAEVAPVYEIGGFDATGWDAFGSVSQVEFGGDGSLYVFDRQSGTISVVAPDGSLVRQFGRQGDGPGEFRNPGAMGVTRDGRVFVQDGGHRAYLEFDRTGEFVRQIPMDVEGGVVVMGALEADPTGPRFFTSAGGGGFMMMMRSGPGEVRAETPQGRPIERVTLEGSVETTPFFTAWDPPEPDAGVEEMPGTGFRVSMPRSVIWEPRLFFQPLPDGGVAVVDSSAYAVKIVGPDGRHIRTVTRPSVEPRRVTDRIRAREIERRVGEILSGGGAQMRIVTNDGGGNVEVPQDRIREMQVNRLNESPFWPEIPVTAAMAAGWDGLIWLERAQVDPTEDGPIDLFRPDGSWVGTLPADGDVRIPNAFGPDGLAAWVERDEFDVATVRVGRLGPTLR